MPTNYETLPHTSEHDTDALNRAGEVHSERLRAHYEQAGERVAEQHEAVGQAAKHEALTAAISHENSPKKELEASSPAVRRGSIKSERTASYKRTMTHIQSELSAPSRTFSKVIHNPAVEKTSEVVGSTIARPNAIVAGAVCAFLFSLITYLIAKHYGYRLSGFESIGAFIAGWVLGLLFDYFKIMITGKRSL